jgi:hypothetical protein
LATRVENLPARIGAIATPDPDWFALLLGPAWTVPTTNPWALPDGFATRYNATVGRIGPRGFEPSIGQQEIAFFAGCCAGVFFKGEFVPVFRWPFSKAVPGHEYKWLARGVGQVTAWASNQGGGGAYRIDHNAPGISNDLEQHYILAGSGFPSGPSFPGMAAPYARSAVTLESRPVQFKWLGAEGKFCPIEQSPPT